MPLTNISTFQVRHYECDANGHLHPANYLRYMQESAFAATAAAGYSKEHYEAMGFIWLARETEIEYLQPVIYGDTVQIKTWVADFRQVRSIRRYEWRKQGSDELIARASTDWVYLNLETQRLTTVPPEMIAAFAAGDPVVSLPREPFPKTPPAPSGAFRLSRRVEWRDIDTANHVNNATYIDYVEDCYLQALKVSGWSLKKMRDVGFALVHRNLRIEYRQPALLDDEVEISTWMFDVKPFSGASHYAIQRPSDASLLAQAQTRWICVDQRTGKPRPMSEHVLSSFAGRIVGVG
jgi:acyl-CoA thioester hydrolase